MILKKQDLSQSSNFITATLLSIKYSGDNDFIIASFSSKENKRKVFFSGLGNLKDPVLQLTYKLAGSWSIHKSFGRQFKFTSQTVIEPITSKGIYYYLIRKCEGIGPTIAQRIVDTYKEKSLELLKESPELVAAEIAGLTEKKVLGIQEFLLENEQSEQVVVSLANVLDGIPGLKKTLSQELMVRYGLEAYAKIKENPYRLIQFSRVGFLMADKVAIQSFKVPPSSAFRVQAAILYILRAEIRDGNTWTPLKEAIQKTALIVGNTKIVREQIGKLVARQVLAQNEKVWATIHELAEKENYIAETLRQMVNPIKSQQIEYDKNKPTYHKKHHSNRNGRLQRHIIESRKEYHAKQTNIVS